MRIPNPGASSVKWALTAADRRLWQRLEDIERALYGGDHAARARPRQAVMRELLAQRVARLEREMR